MLWRQDSFELVTPMVTSGMQGIFRSLVAGSLLAAVFGPAAVFAQAVENARLDRELELTELIRREEAEVGPYSVALIEFYTSLSLLYEEDGDIALAEATIERARQVIRANYGLDSLDQAPSIRRLMDYQERRGDAKAVWDLEQELIGYANRQFDDLRSARIYRDVADRRMSILRRYDAGEFPAEIVLGCYYDDTGTYNELYRLGSRPITALKDLDPVRATEQSTSRRCHSGSQSTARRALLSDAQSNYARAVGVLLSNDEHLPEELEELLMTLVETSYRYGTLSIGRQSLLRLVTERNENSEEILPRVDAILQLADWDVLASASYGRLMVEMALDGYQEAYDLLREHGIEESSIESIFSPEIPVVLPTFVTNPLAPRDGSESESFVDVAFVVGIDGRADEIEVLQSSGDVSRVDERNLVRLIKRRRFRPRLVDGNFAEAAPVTVRYFPNG